MSEFTTTAAELSATSINFSITQNSLYYASDFIIDSNGNKYYTHFYDDPIIYQTNIDGNTYSFSNSNIYGVILNQPSKLNIQGNYLYVLNSQKGNIQSSYIVVLSIPNFQYQSTIILPDNIYNSVYFLIDENYIYYLTTNQNISSIYSYSYNNSSNTKTLIYTLPSDLKNTGCFLFINNNIYFLAII